MRWGTYLKTAFLNRWSLLAFFGGTGLALLSGHADIFLPLVLAGEAAYVGFLSAHPKFQKYVDAQQAKNSLQRDSTTANASVQRMIESLPKDAVQRFENLRWRCLELREIALDLKQPAGGANNPLDSFQVEGLDRLLWVFLKLLFTRYCLGRFLERTDTQAIVLAARQAEERLAAVDQENRDKFKRTLEDHLQTCRDRLANYEKAKANHAFVELEIDRLENKIKSVAELAVNRQEPEFISTQVDQVAHSMVETERTMTELDFATGLGQLEEQTPDLLQSASRTANMHVIE